MKVFRVLFTIAAVLGINGCATAPTSSMQAAGTVAEAVTGSGMAGSVASAMMQNPALVDILVQQLGVSTAQATGGAGSIFSIAQQVMTPSNFGLLSKAVPGMDTMLAAAPAINPSLMGGAASAMGGSNLVKMAALANSFQNLGMNSGMVSQFIPVVMQYLQDQGGSTAMSLLQSAIMP